MVWEGKLLKSKLLKKYEGSVDPQAGKMKESLKSGRTEMKYLEKGKKWVWGGVQLEQDELQPQL